MTTLVNQNITENLNRYLAQKKTNQAILLTGGWGCGKTHFIEDFIKSQDPEFIKLVKVSLFGLRNISEIEDRILGAFYPTLDSKPAKLLNYFTKNLSMAFRLDAVGDDSPETSLTARTEKPNLYNLLINNKKDFVLILDDIERTKIAIHDLLGYINYATETNQIKTILIANETELEKEHNDSYRKFKEKVICKTFHVSHDPKAVIESFLEEEKPQIQDLKNIILETYASSNCRNLRSLKQIIDDFSQLHTSLDDQFTDKHQYINSLTRTFFALSLEIKCATLDREKLLSNEVLRPSSAFTKKYFQFDTPILNENFWIEALFDGNYSKINSASSSLSIFTTPVSPELDTLEKLNRFQLLEEEEFSSLANKLKSEVQACEDDIPTRYIRKANLLAHFIENKLIDMSSAELSKLLREFTKNHQNSKIWKEKKPEELSRYELENLTKNQNLAEACSELISLYKKKFEHAQIDISKNQKQQKIIAFLNSIIKNNRTVLVEILLKENLHTKFLSSIDAKAFVESLLEAPNASIDTFSEIAAERYRMDRFGYNREQNDLYHELNFWEETFTLIHKYLDKAPPLKKYNLNNLANSTISNFKYILSPIEGNDQ